MASLHQVSSNWSHLDKTYVFSRWWRCLGLPFRISSRNGRVTVNSLKASLKQRSWTAALPLLISSTSSLSPQLLFLVVDLLLAFSLRPHSCPLQLQFGTSSWGALFLLLEQLLAKNHLQGRSHWPSASSRGAHLHPLVDLHSVESRCLTPVADVPWGGNFYGPW